MSTQIQLFQFNTSDVRTLKHDDGSIWFVLKDLCDVLGLRVNDVLQRLDKDDTDQIGLTDEAGRIQKMYIVNEPGMYDVILRSDKPEAKDIKRWITHDVLPSIRKTGGYISMQSPLNLLSFTEIPVQIEENKIFNGRNYDQGGTHGTIQANVDFCILHTGKKPAQLVNEAKAEKIPSKHRTSGMAVIRHKHPIIAARMALAKRLQRLENKENGRPMTMPEAKELASKADEFFQ